MSDAIKPVEVKLHRANGCPIWSPRLSTWGPHDPVASRGFLWVPDPTPGLRFLGAQLVSRRQSTGLYDVLVAPGWWMGFIDPSSESINGLRGGGEFTVGAGVFTDVNPVASKPLYFQPAATVALASVTNRGRGWEWPMRTPEYPWPLLILATSIGSDAEVSVAPQWGVPDA